MRGTGAIRCRRLLSATVLGAAVLAGQSILPAGTSYAQTGPDAGVARKAFSIPAGQLSSALVTFGQQAGLQISYVPSLARGVPTAGVAGNMSSDAALSRLLAGTGLVHRFDDARTVVITRSGGSAEAAATVAPADDGSLVLDTISVQGENARGRFEGYVPTRSGTAAKTDTPFLESPQTVAVVGRDQMEDQGVVSVSESLRYSSGVLTETAGGQSRRFDSFFIRGVGGFGSAAQYASYVDGLRWVYPLRTAVQIDPYMLERVEVMKGPSSALYGQGSAGGFVNMISKTPSLDAKNEVFTTVGSHNRVEAGFDLSGALDENNEWLYRVVGLGRIADTQIDFQRDERIVIAPSLTWQPTDDTSLTLQAMYQHDPQAPDAGFVDPMGSLYDIPGFGKLPRNYYQGDPNFMKYERTEASIGYQFDHRFNDTFRFRSNARFGYMESSTRTIENGIYRWGDPNNWSYTAPNEIYRTWYAAEHEAWSFAIDNNLTAEFETGPIGHKLLLGVDHLRFSGEQLSTGGAGNCTAGWSCSPDNSSGYFGDSKDIWIWDAFNPTYGYDFSDLKDWANTALHFPGYPPAWNQGLRQTGVYVQDQMELNNWRLALTGRYDWSKQTNNRFMYSTNSEWEWVNRETSDEAFTGRAALAYAFDNGLLPFIGYSTSFDPISIISADLNTKGAGTYPFEAHAFEPERGSGYEFGLRYQSPDTGLYLSATYFNGKKEKFAVPTGSTQGCNPPFGILTCYTQDTEAEARGIELEARGEVLPGLHLIANYTWTDARITRLDPENESIIAFMKQAGHVSDDFRPQPVGVPEHMASLYANYTFGGGFLEGLSIGGGVRYVGRMAATPLNVWYGPTWTGGYYQPYPTPHWNWEAGERAYMPATVPSRTLFDLSLNYDFGRKFENLEGMSLNVAATNIFDKKYVAACNGYGTCTWGDGRDIRATLKYRW